MVVYKRLHLCLLKWKKAFLGPDGDLRQWHWGRFVEAEPPWRCLQSLVGAVSALPQGAAAVSVPVSVRRIPIEDCLSFPGILSSFRGGQKQRWQKLENSISFIQPESQHKDRRRKPSSLFWPENPSPGSIVPIHKIVVGQGKHQQGQNQISSLLFAFEPENNHIFLWAPSIL